MPPQEVKERLEIIEWKVRDIQHVPRASKGTVAGVVQMFKLDYVWLPTSAMCKGQPSK